jgi:hypothetical protein
MTDEVTAVKDMAAEINQLHLEQCATAKQALETAIRIGELLAEQRGKSKRGEWLPWFDANIHFSRKTGDNYRRVFKHRDKFVNVTNLSDAYRIAIPKPKKIKKMQPVTNIRLFGGIPVKLELSDKEFKLLNRALNPQSAPNEIEKALITFGLSLRTRRSCIQRFLGTDKAA